MSNLTDALIAAKLVGGSGGSGGGSGLPEITPGSQTVVFAEQSVSFSVSEGPDGLYSAMLQFVTIASGVTYTVTWDGTTYTCVGSEISMGGQTGIVAGNLSIDGPGEDTGEPFVLVHVSSMNGTNVATTTAGSHTIGVTTGTPQTPPDGYVLGVDGGEWKAVPSGGGESGGGTLIIHFDDDTGVCDTTWQDILDALERGDRVISLFLEPGGASVQQEPILMAVHSSKYTIISLSAMIGDSAPASCDSPNGYPVR